MPATHRVAGELLVVAGPRAETAASTLVLLHGRGEYHGQVLDLWSSADVDCGPDDRGLADWGLVALQAGFRIGPASYRWFGYLEESGEVLAVEPGEERQSWDALVDFLEVRRATDPGRPIRLFGHSQGGMMAASIALLRPDLIDGCAVVNARVLPEALARISGELRLAGLPVFVAHALADDVVPVAHGRRTCELFTRAGADVVHREYRGGHALTSDMVVDAAAWLRTSSSAIGAGPIGAGS